MDETANQPGPAASRLAAELREIRDRTGRSLRSLERHTHASDSSLSRYLAGRTLPPWPVVESMCLLAGWDPARLRALWEAARREFAPQAGASADGGAAMTDDAHPSDDPCRPVAEQVPDDGPADLAVAPPLTVRSPEASRWYRRWARIMPGFGSGVLVGALLILATTWITRPDEVPASSTGDVARADLYAEVSLFAAQADGSLALVWNRTVSCALPAEYRRVYALPVQAVDKVTAYLIQHADCTVKLFQEAGGRGYGESLTSDGKIHDVSSHTALHSMAVVAYSESGQQPTE